MFDAIRNNRRIVQVILLLVAIPFAFFGVDFLRSGGSVPHVAKVGKIEIPLTQYQEALRDRLKGGEPSEAEARAILKNLVDYQLLAQEVAQQRLLIDNATLRDVLFSLPVFQEKGKFSETRYKSALARENMTPEQFEAGLREKIQFQFLVSTLQESAIVPRTIANRVAALLTEVREVQESLVSGKDFVDQVKLEAGDAQKFYDDNIDRFKQPEQVKVEYVALENIPEERRASHILLTTAGADKDKMKAEAERLLAEAQKSPAQFAELAQKYSQDPGSAANGGDLGFFAREVMVKPFSDAVFSMKEGELSGLVETDFGFHIIKVTGIKPGRFGDRSFAEIEEEFSNLVFNDHPGSLKPAAEKYNLALRQSGWLPRQEGEATYGVFDNPDLRQAIFSDDVIKEGHNSKAVQVAPGIIVSARLLEYQPADQRSFESARTEIETYLKHERAVALAIEAGKTRLSELKEGKAAKTPRWGASQGVARLNPGKLENIAALSAIFAADVKTLPAYVGVEAPGAGYALYKIGKVTENPMDEAQIQAFAQQDLARIAGDTQLSAYVNALRQRHKVEINSAALEKKE
jgi:peptidyl-prolyl cis-trans isomerase D